MTAFDPDAWPNLWTALGKLVISSGGLEEPRSLRRSQHDGRPHWRRTELVIDGYSASQMNDRAERLAYQVLEDSLQEDVIKWLRRVGSIQTRRKEIRHSSRSSILTADGPIGPAAPSSNVPMAKPGLDLVSQALRPGHDSPGTSEPSPGDREG